MALQTNNSSVFAADVASDGMVVVTQLVLGDELQLQAPPRMNER